MRRYVLAALVLSALAGCQSTGKGKKEFDVSQQLVQPGIMLRPLLTLSRQLPRSRIINSIQLSLAVYA
jgi:hypothetical protein